MPQVKLLATAVGRYEAVKGELLDITDEEFARWAPTGLVAKVGSKEAKEAEAQVERHSDGDGTAPVESGGGDVPKAVDETSKAPAEAPAPKRTRRSRSSATS